MENNDPESSIVSGLPSSDIENQKGILKHMLKSFGQGFAAATVPGYQSPGQSYSPDEAAFLVNPSDPAAAAQTKQRLVEMFKNKPVPKDFTHMLAAYGKLHESEQAKAAANEEKKLTDQDVESVAQSLASGEMSPSMLPQIAGRGGIKDRLRIFKRAKEINPKWNPEQANVSFQSKLSGGQALARVQQGKGQEVGAVAGSMEDMLSYLEPLIPKLSPSKLKVLNSAFQRGLQQVNDPDVNEALGYLSSAKGFYASMLKNGGTPNDMELKQAADVMSLALNKQGFAGMKKALTREAQSRVKRIQGKGFNEQVIPTGNNADQYLKSLGL